MKPREQQRLKPFTCSRGAFEEESIDCVDRFYGGRTRGWNAEKTRLLEC